MDPSLVIDSTASADSSQPRTLREELLCSVFAGTLQRPSVGVEEDFFALGGDSLKATLALGQIRERMDGGLSMRAFFQLRTVARLAAALPREAAGFDAEECLEAGAGGASFEVGAGARTGSVARSARELASCEPPELGARVLQFARGRSLAPSVVYLALWLDLLLESGIEAFPVDVELGAAAERFRVRSAEHSDGAEFDRGHGALQRALLGAEPEVALGLAARCAFVHRHAELAGSVRTVPAGGFGLFVTEKPATLLRLFADGEATPALDAPGLLERYQRLAETL